MDIYYKLKKREILLSFALFVVVPGQIVLAYFSSKVNSDSEDNTSNFQTINLLVSLVLVGLLLFLRFTEFNSNKIFYCHTPGKQRYILKIVVECVVIAIFHPPGLFAENSNEEFDTRIKHSVESFIYCLYCFKIVFMVLFPLKLVEYVHMDPTMSLKTRLNYSSLTSMRILLYFYSLHTFTLFFTLIGVFCGLGIVEIEKRFEGNQENKLNAVRNGIYFSFMSLMNIGFGDYTPDSKAGKFVSICIVVMGLVLFSILVSSFLRILGFTEKEKELFEAKENINVTAEIQTKSRELLINALKRNNLIKTPSSLKDRFKQIYDNYQSAKHLSFQLNYLKASTHSNLQPAEAFLQSVNDRLDSALAEPVSRTVLATTAHLANANEALIANKELKTKIELEMEKFKQIFISKTVI